MNKANQTPNSPSASGEFQAISMRHYEVLTNRGYASPTQLHLTGTLLRNSNWKTYWRAGQSRGGTVFIKINYGYPSPGNRIIGEKEAWLPGYFASFFQSLPDITFPRVVDSWEFDGAYAVAFEEVACNGRSLPMLVSDPTQRSLLVEFLRIWMRIPVPDWWDPRYVVNDFGMQRELTTEPENLSPFGFDLDDNVCVDGEARLFLYDFEFIQWTSRGLQQLYLALKILESRREALQSLFGRGVASELIRQVQRQERQPALAQALRAYKARNSRKRRTDLASRISTTYAALLARLRCR